MLILVSGLPGVGKTTVAKAVTQALSAVYLRADTIEQAMVEAGFNLDQIGGAGYNVAARVARENLRLGQNVVMDCVNPWPLTREMWRDAAREAGKNLLEVELVCSDAEEHRRRVETRTVDIKGLRAPTWQDVIDRDYRPWDVDPLRIDTVSIGVDDAVKLIVEAMRLS